MAERGESTRFDMRTSAYPCFLNPQRALCISMQAKLVAVVVSKTAFLSCSKLSQHSVLSRPISLVLQVLNTKLQG